MGGWVGGGCVVVDPALTVRISSTDMVATCAGGTAPAMMLARSSALDLMLLTLLLIRVL